MGNDFRTAHVPGTDMLNWYSGNGYSKCVGIMMNTRALMELIILNVGYDLGVIPPNVFTMLVLMAIFSTIITAPFLRLWLPEMGHDIPAFEAGFEP